MSEARRVSRSFEPPGGPSPNHCKLCGRNIVQAIQAAPDADRTDWGRRLPMVRCSSIVGAPPVCRCCALAITRDFAAVARTMLKEEKKK